MSKRLEGKKELLHDAAATARGIESIADAIAEAAVECGPCAIVGIRTRGLTLARRVHAILEARGEAPVLGSLDITLYRDDLSTMGPQPIVGVSDLPFDLDGCTVFLVDDVLYTGRTVRAAIDALLAFGRPAAIRLAALVDRGHREYPIHADFVPFRIATRKDQVVEVNLSEVDGCDRIELVSPEGGIRHGR